MNILQEKLIKALEAEKQKTPEQLQAKMAEIYKGISKEDAVRINNGLTALLDAQTKEEQDRITKDYNKLLAEIKKKYGKSGGR